MNILKGSILSVIVLSLVAFSTAIERQNVDIESSQIKWEGEKLTGSHYGTIDLKEGYFEMEGGELVGGEFIADMSTIDITDLEGDQKAELMGHLRSDDFFSVDDYEEAKFVINTVANKGDSYGVSGDLTIKGKTNPIAFDLKMNGNTATTELAIDRTKYNVRYGSDSFFDNLGDKVIYDEFKLDIKLVMK